MHDTVEIRHLRMVQMLAECGSVSAAANRMFLTQSALSHQIRLLEKHFGVSLFERKSVPVRFTPAGVRLLKLAADVLPLLEEAGRDMTQIVSGGSGELRVAVECHTCFDWLMPATDTFRKLWPKVEVDIVSGFQADPVGLLLTGRADLAIVSEAEAQEGVDFHPLFAYETVGICAKDHRLAGQEIWQPEDFAGETLITYPVPDDMLDIWRKILAPAGVRPVRRYSELTAAVIQLVSSKRGIAALPHWAVLPFVEKGYVTTGRIGKEGLQSTLYAAIRSADAGEVYHEHFCRLVREHGFADLPGLSPLAYP